MTVGEQIPQVELEAACGKMLDQLLPTGMAWPRPLSPDLQKLVDSAAVELARVKDRSGAALREMDPRLTAELLAEWEALCGLPDPCETDPTSSSVERRFNLVAKLNQRGNLSPAFYVAYALSLGYVIEIEESIGTLFETGLAGAGDPIGGVSVIYEWTVHSAKFTPTYFQAGSSGAGEPLASWGDERLECAINRLKPAHTTVVFVYDLTWVGYAPWGHYACPAGVALRLRANQIHSVTY